MRILSVTPYCISNYGAMLQAWALRSVLEKMGHSVQYLQYPYFWVRHFGWSRLLRSRSLAALRSKLATNRQMEIVRQEVGGWNETRPYRNPEELAADPPTADCYLVGSDQVFHLNFLKGVSESRHALLNFGADSVRRVAYATSFGCPVWTDEVIANHQWGVPLLKRFSSIGLRETTGVELLRKWSGIQGAWTPDPTLLLDANAYCRQFKVERVQKARRRIVSYMLGFTNEPHRKSLHDHCCRRVAAHLDGAVDFVEIQPRQSLGYWLNNIANADYVITNSFHGICFSLIFNRPFLPLGFDGAEAWRNERACDILAHVGLLDRYLTVQNQSKVDAVLSRPFDWESLNVSRRDFAKIGRQFLSEAF